MWRVKLYLFKDHHEYKSIKNVQIITKFHYLCMWFEKTLTKTLWKKEEALCLHLFGLKPEKFQITNEELHSGSHA